ncbi:MAG TPA: hypothetical protein VFK02_06415 [Kofleriaceae bacterium]|nr:hypothetical protein [Kofleriaceae bacterium]
MASKKKPAAASAAGSGTAAAGQDRNDEPERGDRPERGERGDRPERGERPEASEPPARSEGPDAREPATAPPPAPPRPSEDGSSRTTLALEHGAKAWGARFVKAGFATTAAGDLAFALGFPHLEYIVDNHPDDARAEMIAYERRSYRLGWPRNVAIRWCRITACKGFKRTPQGATELDGAGKKAIKNGAPLGPDEVALTLKAMFSDTTSYEDLRELVRLFEAFVGPELVATSIVDALEKSSNNVWGHQDPDRAQVMHHLGFVLLRLPAALTDKLRARLAAIFERRVKALPTKELGPRKGERGSLLRALDVVLNGKAGAERSGERNEDAIEPGDLVHVTDDVAFVRDAACRVTSPDPRLVFLGGEPVLEHLLAVFPRLRGQHHLVLDGFAEVASPLAVELLQRVARGKEASERARALLAARGL